MFMVSTIMIPIIRDSCHDHDVHFFEDNCDARNDDDDNHDDDGQDYSCFFSSITQQKWLGFEKSEPLDSDVYFCFGFWFQ